MTDPTPVPSNADAGTPLIYALMRNGVVIDHAHSLAELEEWEINDGSVIVPLYRAPVSPSEPAPTARVLAEIAAELKVEFGVEKALSELVNDAFYAERCGKKGFDPVKATQAFADKYFKAVAHAVPSAAGVGGVVTEALIYFEQLDGVQAEKGIPVSGMIRKYIRAAIAALRRAAPSEGTTPEAK